MPTCETVTNTHMNNAFSP